MSKILSFALIVACILGGSCIAVADEPNENTSFDQNSFEVFVECFEAFCKEYFKEETEIEHADVDVDALTEEMAKLSPEEAYLAYAKTCILIITAASNNGYEATTSWYHYDNEEVIKALVFSDDPYSCDITIPRNSEKNEYTELLGCIYGYNNLQTNLELLEELMDNSPEVPEKYSHIDEKIKTAYRKLTELYVFLTNWFNGTDTRGVLNKWRNAEKLYWDDSINTLKALLYVDTMCD